MSIGFTIRPREGIALPRDDQEDETGPRPSFTDLMFNPVTDADWKNFIHENLCPQGKKEKSVPIAKSTKRVTSQPEPLPAELDGLSTIELGRRHLNGTGAAAHRAKANGKPPKGVRFKGQIVGPKCFVEEHGLVIDPEIRDLIEPLARHEREELEKHLDRDGCLDPLRAWKETGILLDGHNRFDYCAKKKIEVAVEWLSFPDRTAAIDWVLSNQLGRRNISDDQRSYLIGKRLENEKQSRGGRRTKAKPQVEGLTPADHSPKATGNTAQRIAKETGVSRATVERNAVQARAVDALVKCGASRQELVKGQKKMSQAAAQAVAKMPPSKIREVARKLNSGYATIDSALPAKATPLQQAARGTKPAKAETKPAAGETEAWQTVVNRLHELRRMLALKDPKRGPVVNLVDELVKFAEGRL